MKSRLLSLGSISEGTLRTEDLLEAIASELSPLRLSRAHRKLVNEAGRIDPESDEAGDLLQELCDAAESYLPPYAYLAMHKHDGACFGVWASVDSLEEDAASGEVLKVSDLSEVPAGYVGYLLHVNDHGNATLYTRHRNGRLSEHWAIV